MHITKKKRDAIVKLHRQGESIELLTAISGLNRTTITSIIKKDDSEKLFREFNMVSEKFRLSVDKCFRSGKNLQS